MLSYARRHQLGASLIYHIYSRSNGGILIFESKEEEAGRAKELLFNSLRVL